MPRQRPLLLTPLLHLTMHLTPLVPHPLPRTAVLVLDDALPVRFVIVVDVSGISSHASVFVGGFEILDADSFFTFGGRSHRRAAGFAGVVMIGMVVFSMTGGTSVPTRWWTARRGTISPTAVLSAAGSSVLGGAFGTNVVNDFEPPDHFLLGDLHGGMTAAVSVAVEGEFAVATGLGGLAGLSSASGFGGTGGFARGGGLAGFEGDVVVVEADVFASGAAGAGSYYLPATTKHPLLRHLNMRMKDTTSIPIELSVSISSTRRWFGR